jgi:hypothetical protein
VLRNSSSRKNNVRSISFLGAIEKSQFGAAKRFLPNKTFTHTPGPGNYEFEGTIAKPDSLKYSFGYRSDVDVNGTLPTNPAIGPGSYYPKYTQFIKGFKISKSSKPEKEGSIFITNEKNKLKDQQSKELRAPNMPMSANKRVVKPRPTFAQAARDCDFKQTLRNVGPSPATYLVNEHNPSEYGNWTAKAYTFGGKLPISSEKPSTNPGPDSYTVNSGLLKNHRGFSFTKAIQKEPRMQSIHSKQSLNSQSDDEGPQKHAQKYRGGDFPKAKRNSSLLTIGPGPGAYQPKHQLVEKSPKKTLIGTKIYSRKQRKEKENEGGDRFIGAEDFKHVDAEVKLGSFGKANRRLNLDNAPLISDRRANPQMYNVRRAIGAQGFSFAKRERYPQDPQENTEIGPGFYSIKSTVPQIQPWIKWGNEHR